MLSDPIKLQELIRQERARRSLIDFTLHTYPDYEAGWFHRTVAAELDAFFAAVSRRESPRLMVFAPPRHGKSELFSRRGPAFFLGRHPDLSIIATSYAESLAGDMNRDVQRIIDSDEYKNIFPATRLGGGALRNSDIFEITGHRGRYRSAGVGGGITGQGAHLLIIDDPVKDAAQANSQTYRDNAWNWYRTTAYTRLMPGGGVLLAQTRWHEDDLAGRLLAAMKKGQGDKWRIVLYPAIAEVDETHRRKGEALHPERYPIDQLEAIKIVTGSYAWAALYQQNPQPAEGNKFKRGWFRYWKVEGTGDAAIYRMLDAAGSTVRSVRARDCRRFGTSDLAASLKTSADYTVIAAWAVTPESDLLLLDLVRDHFEEPEILLQARAIFRRHSLQYLTVEQNFIGLGVIQTLRRGRIDPETREHVPGLPVRAFKAATDKLSRAGTAIVRCEAGQVYWPESAPWLGDFEHELLGFPVGAAHDDQVDALSMAADDVFWGGAAAEPDDMKKAREEAEAAAELAAKRARAAERQADADDPHWWGDNE